MNLRTNSIALIASGVLLAGSAAAYGQNYPSPSPPRGGQQPPTTSSGATTTAPDSAASRNAALKPADTTFLMKAAMGGEAEVELGTLAQQKASNPKVKALGERMETDHKKANEDLQALAVSKGLTLSGGLDKEQQAEKARLEKLDGAAFDQAYTNLMVSDHTKDIKEFEAAAKSSDQAVKSFAEKTLPTLREHLKMAQDAKAAVSGKSQSSTATSDKPVPTSGNNPPPAR